MTLRLLMVLMLTALAVPRAAAQSSTAEAEMLFRKGQDLLAQGKIAEACDAFDASQRVEPAVTTQLNQANCRERNGQLATAWGLFVDAARQTRGATRGEKKKLHKVATDRAAKLEPRLSTLTIAVPEQHRVGGLEILRDGAVVDPATWNQALPVDGGSYTVTARAPGNAEWASTVVVGAERDAKTIEIPKLTAAALGDDDSDGAPPRRSKRLPLILGGAALALGGGAIGFSLWGDATYDKAKVEPDLARQRDLWHSANRKRYVAEGLGVAALGCAGVAVWMYLRGRGDGGAEEEDEEDEDDVAVRVAPQVGPDGGGIAIVGWF